MMAAWMRPAAQRESHREASHRSDCRANRKRPLSVAQDVRPKGIREDQEKRLTRLETLVGETQALLSEIRTDVKILLRGGQQ